jgi:hypothetical protein
MKYFLAFTVTVITFLFSCVKSDSVEGESRPNPKTTNPYNISPIPKSGQLKESYNSLVAKLDAGSISFDTFYSELKALLAPYKKNKSTMNGEVSHSNASRFPAYVTMECPYQGNPVACREFWLNDCMNFCQDQYWIINEVLMQEEDNITSQYFVAREKCFSDSTIKTPQQTDSCHRAAQLAFNLAMNPIIQAYSQASIDWELCLSDCGGRFQ